MQLRRFEEKLLLSWLTKKTRKPLILRGARQVGKSSLVRNVASLSQRICLELNFERYPEQADFFKTKDPVIILQNLSIYFKRSINPENCILFLDEIQSAPHLIEILRYFYEEKPELAIIAAGSLLDFVLAEPAFSVPVGRIEYFHLGPLSFEDFLVALKEEALLEWMQNFHLGQDIPLPLHTRSQNFLKEFWITGGMPEVVAHYAEHHDFQEVNNIKQNILQGYLEDFHKYGRITHIPLLRRAFKTIGHLVGKKIKYTQLDPDAKSAQVKQAIEYLNLAKIIHLVYHSHANGVPLGAQINTKIFKAIFLDIGLLNSALGLTELYLIQNTDWAWVNQGSLAEQFIGQALLKLYPSYQTPEVYYWTREKAQSSAELDYIWQYENHIIPIEVKAGKTGTLKSLLYFIQEKKCSYAVRFNNDLPSLLKKNDYSLVSLPFYLSGQLNRLLKDLIECNSMVQPL